MLQGHAVKRGMLIARGEYCLFADADGATKVTELEKLEDALSLGMTAGAAVHAFFKPCELSQPVSVLGAQTKKAPGAQTKY